MLLSGSVNELKKADDQQRMLQEAQMTATRIAQPTKILCEVFRKLDPLVNQHNHGFKGHHLGWFFSTMEKLIFFHGLYG